MQSQGVCTQPVSGWDIFFRVQAKFGMVGRGSIPVMASEAFFFCQLVFDSVAKGREAVPGQYSCEEEADCFGFAFWADLYLPFRPAGKTTGHLGWF